MLQKLRSMLVAMQADYESPVDETLKNVRIDIVGIFRASRQVVMPNRQRHAPIFDMPGDRSGRACHTVRVDAASTIEKVVVATTGQTDDDQT